MSIESEHENNVEVGVIGGGISGLAVAHYLTQAGAKVTILESSTELGGLGSFFNYRNQSLERFYHCMLPSDTHLLSLLQDIDLVQHTYWKDTSFGFMHLNKLYPLNTPLELLRFSPLPMIDRIRVGVTGLWGSLRPAKGLDDKTCEAWLSGLSGRRAFNTFWKPMLQAKFGDRYASVPALWFWTRFNREKGAKKERKGYIAGGYKRITDALADSLVSKGVVINVNSPVSQITQNPDGSPVVIFPDGTRKSFDKIVYAGPITRLQNLVNQEELKCSSDALGIDIDMQGVVNAVLTLRRGFSKHYWVAAVDPDIPFQGVVESTTLLNKEDTAGVHLIYLMNYLHRSDPLFSQPDDEVLASYRQGLKKMFPDLQDEEIIDQFVFRSPYVEPLYTLGYEKRKPPIALKAGRIYLATTAQIYPEVTSWNGSVGLAKIVAAQLLAEA